MKKMLSMTNDQINETIEFWSPLLGISDWDVDWDIVTQANIPDNLAEVNWLLSKRSAYIKIADPSTWAKGTEPASMEVSLVHEMIHISQAPLLDKIKNMLSPEEDAIMTEQTTDRYARTLVALRRSSIKRMSWEINNKQGRHK